MNNTVAFMVLVLAAGSAGAASAPLTMLNPRPLAKDIAAMPQIAAPSDDAQRRINAALQRLDATVRAAAADCRKSAEGPDAADAGWSRSVEVAMAGPVYLSLVIRDDAFCGGAHPNTATMSIVYDLRSGRPVDWRKLLPSSLTGKVALAEGMDGTRMVTLASPQLQALYLKGYRKTELGTDPQCTDAVATDDPPASMVWLDARQGGLAVQFDLAHVVQACANPVVIPAAVLRSEGADAGLVSAIDAAHSRP
jgi:hypothetical protein